MATQKLNIDIIARDKSKQALNNLQGNLARVRQSVFNLRNAFIGLGAGLAIKGIVNAGIQVEMLGVQLKSLMGDANAGKKALKDILDFAKTTPFELKNIQQGVTSLATVRKQAESIERRDDYVRLTAMLENNRVIRPWWANSFP